DRPAGSRRARSAARRNGTGDRLADRTGDGLWRHRGRGGARAHRRYHGAGGEVVGWRARRFAARPALCPPRALVERACRHGGATPADAVGSVPARRQRCLLDRGAAAAGWRVAGWRPRTTLALLASDPA